MERIISYSDLPEAKGQSIYLRLETDPDLLFTLLDKGYRVIDNIIDADRDTIYVTGRRQDYYSSSTKEFKRMVNDRINELLGDKGITKPRTYNFSYEDLLEHKYTLPFVFKNEGLNGGREKFLINTEEDYENLICACRFLLESNLLLLGGNMKNDLSYRINYDVYLSYFTIQEYIETPTKLNTTVRLLTSSSNDLLYASLKYNPSVEYVDDSSLLGVLLSKIYPLSTKSIVSNTLSGGENLLLGEDDYSRRERRLLDLHNIDSDQFRDLVQSSQDVHEELHQELGIICGFDYIYDREREKWYLLEVHSRPMVGDYSKRQGIRYRTKDDRVVAEGRVRATALAKTLQKTR